MPLLFLSSSLRGRVEANWNAVAYPSIFALALLTNYKRIWIKATLWIWAFAILILMSQMQFKWLPIEERRLKTSEFYAFDDFLTYPEKYKPFYASSYQMASMLYYKTKVPVYKLKGTHRTDHFDFLNESRPAANSFY